MMYKKRLLKIFIFGFATLVFLVVPKAYAKYVYNEDITIANINIKANKTDNSKVTVNSVKKAPSSNTKINKKQNTENKVTTDADVNANNNVENADNENSVIKYKKTESKTQNESYYHFSD